MPRLKNFDRSLRQDAARAQEELRTLVADSTAPRDPRAQAKHYRQYLAEANRVIGTLQVRIANIEQKAVKAKEDTEYWLSLCVPRSQHEREKLAAFMLARNKAAMLAEPDDVPNNLSHAIDNIKPPQNWSK